MRRTHSNHESAWTSLLLNISAAFLLALSCATAWADPGQVKWEDRFDAGNNPAFLPPIVADSTAVVGNTYFVAASWPFLDSPGSNANIHLRAYNVGSGTLRWDSVWAPTGSDDEATGLTASGHVIAVAGRTGLNSTGNNAFVVRAFNAVDGGTLWQDQCGTASDSGATSITSAANRVFAAGTCLPAGDGNSGLLRAYAARTGRLLWQVHEATPPQALAVSGRRLFELANGASGDLMLRAYDMRNGRQLWEIHAGTGGTQSGSQLATGGNAVYVSWDAGASGGTVHGIAAYSARSGAGLWEVDASDQVTALAWSRDRLFAGQSGGETLLTAYNAANGAVLWQDQPGTVPTTYSAQAVIVAYGHVYLAGSSFTSGAEDAANWLVRAYTLKGRLSWQDNQPDNNKLDAAATNLAWGGGKVIAAGSTGRDTPPFGALQGWIRAYAAGGGRSSRFGWNRRWWNRFAWNRLR